jgi:hypothetical protein
MPGSRQFVGIVLLLSAVLRLSLAVLGGQDFFGDEIRHTRGYGIYRAVLDGEPERLKLQLVKPDHPGFSLVLGALAPVHHALATIAGHGDWSTYAGVRPTLWLGAGLLGLSSTASLFFIHRIALAAGARREAADWALLLAACSTCLWFYSRHLVPYDCALAAALGSIWLALAGRGAAAVLGSGALAAATLTLYSGYWFLVPLCALAHVGRGELGARALRWTLGFLLVLLPVLLPGALWEGALYWRSLVGFSGSAVHGEFAEGWSLPGRYAWATEGWFGAAVAAAIAGGICARRGIRLGAGAPAGRWLVLLLAGYGLLVVTANLLEAFVVYGRTARALAPFVCLLAGESLAALTADLPRARRLAMIGSVALALSNFLAHARLEFPVEFERTARRLIDGVPVRVFSFSAVQPLARLEPVTRPEFAVVNTGTLHPLGEFIGYPAGETRRRAWHPSAAPAYQFEGYTPRERGLLRQHPPEMRLVRIGN